MAKNILQVFEQNPITTNQSTDLMYFGQSPYGANNDAAMTFENFSAQFLSPGTGVDSVEGSAEEVLVNGTSGVPQTGALTLSTPQPIASTSSPTFNNLTLKGATINNASGLPAISILDNPIAVNQFVFSNSSSGTYPTLSGDGTDTNVGMQFSGKGTGNFSFISNDPNIPITFFNGTLAQHKTNFSFSNTNAIRTVSFQDEDGTVAYLSDIPGAESSWINVTGTSQAMLPAHGYVANNNISQVNLALPVTAPFGSLLYIQGSGSGGWLISQNAGQNIQVGNVSSTVGIAGGIASTNQYDSIVLVCTVANTTWCALGAPQSSGLGII